MKSIGFKFLIFILVLCLCCPVFNVSAEASEIIQLSVDCSGNAIVGGEIVVKITTSKPLYNLMALEFTLAYESDYVSPVITQNSEEKLEMNALITSMPNGWEQMCSHSAEKSIYNFRFAMVDENCYFGKDGSLVLEIPFKIKNAGSFDFEISAKDIIAVGADENLTIYSGKGDTVSFVAASEKDKIGIKLKGNEKAISGSTYYMDIEAVNLGDVSGLIGFEFKLKYDKSLFSPIITQNSEENPQMDEFMVSTPKNSWEQICSLNSAEGYYTLRFAALHCESKTEAEILASGKSILLSIPFKVIGNEGKDGGFSVENASIIGIDNDSAIVGGVGEDLNVSIIKGEVLNIPEDYIVTDRAICKIREKTEISDFLADFGSAYITDSEGNRVSNGYIKTDYILTNGAESYTLSVLGDINGDGEVSSKDYSLLKRMCMGTFIPTKAQKHSACIVNKSEPAAKDYSALKRHCFGTYDIYK